MSRGLIFWVLMLIWLVFGLINVYPLHDWRLAAGPLLEFVLFLLLGWQCYGSPVKD